MDFSATGGAVQYPVRGFGTFKATRLQLDASAEKILSALESKMLWRQRAFIILLALSFFAKSSNAQTPLNVTDFGAVGDAEQVWVSTVAGSAVVTFTNGLSGADVGKTVELFGVGQTNVGSNISGQVVTNAQDLIAVIAAVSGNNATLSGDIPTVTSNSVYCIYGANNVNAFASCIAACPTNATIYIPHGTVSAWGTTNAYLLIPPQQYTNFFWTFSPDNNGDFGIQLFRGGLMFCGDGDGQTILMADGAYKNEESNGTYPRDHGGFCERGGIFVCIAPITNNYPLIWTNLTFDGGLPMGLTGNQAVQPANPVDGMGWDGTSCAGLDSFDPAQGTEPGNSLLEFANCEFRHFRGEVIKGVAGAWGERNEMIMVTNCVFWDGNATAFNYNYAHTIADCTFSNMYQIEEFYLAYPTNAASWFINNYATNIAHCFVALNGGTATNQPYYISNNVFISSGWAGATNGTMDGIITTPACNVTIVNNQFICSNYTVCVDLGAPGAQGYFNNSNIWIAGNTFNQPNIILESGGASQPGSGWGVQNVTVSNNVLIPYATCSPRAFINFGWYTNITFVNNDFYATNPFGSDVQWQSGNLGWQYVTILTNTIYHAPLYNYGSPEIKTLSYGGGPWYQTTHNNGDTFILSDADASQIPAGAQMVLDNTTNDGGNNGIYTIYLNSAKTRSQMTTNGQINVFNWIKGIGWVNANVVQSNAVQSATVGFTMTPTNGIVPATAQFQSPITDSTGSTITSWNWNFGDGTTGTGQSPTHVYTTVGTFSPSLVFTNSNGTAGRSSGAAIIVNQVKLGQVFSAGTMTLAWPTNAVGYALQYTTNLSPPVVWRPFLSTPAIVNGQYIATSLTSGPQMFFRLATKISALISSPSQPKLALIIAGEKLVLSWPASAVGFILQSTTNLSPPVNWSTVPATPVSVGGQDVVTNSISGPQMFFRLMN